MVFKMIFLSRIFFYNVFKVLSIFLFGTILRLHSKKFFFVEKIKYFVYFFPTFDNIFYLFKRVFLRFCISNLVVASIFLMKKKKKKKKKMRNKRTRKNKKGKKKKKKKERKKMREKRKKKLKRRKK